MNAKQPNPDPTIGKDGKCYYGAYNWAVPRILELRLTCAGPEVIARQIQRETGFERASHEHHSAREAVAPSGAMVAYILKRHGLGYKRPIPNNHRAYDMGGQDGLRYCARWENGTIVEWVENV